MKLEKVTFGKRTVTLQWMVGDYDPGQPGRHTLSISYSHISSCEISGTDKPDVALAIVTQRCCFEFTGFDGYGEKASLVELAAELHQRMEACQ